jgi:hypothetical protein
MAYTGALLSARPRHNPRKRRHRITTELKCDDGLSLLSCGPNMAHTGALPSAHPRLWGEKDRKQACVMWWQWQWSSPQPQQHGWSLRPCQSAWAATHALPCKRHRWTKIQLHSCALVWSAQAHCPWRTHDWKQRVMATRACVRWRAVGQSATPTTQRRVLRLRVRTWSRACVPQCLCCMQLTRSSALAVIHRQGSLAHSAIQCSRCGLPRRRSHKASWVAGGCNICKACTHSLV